MPNNSLPELSFQPAVQGYSFINKSSKPSSPDTKKKLKLNPPLLLILEILGLVMAFIVLLLVLNFFNILSLSEIYPNQFGFLPHLSKTSNTKPGNQASTKATPSPVQPTPGTSNSLEHISIGICPVSIGCKKVVQISSPSAEGNFYGLGFNLSTDSAILAVFNGKIGTENSSESGKMTTIVNLTDPIGVQKFVYKFAKNAYTPSIISGSVREGQKIGDFKNAATLTYSGEPYSLIFYMQSLTSNEYIQLIPSNDGKTLER